MSHYRTLVIGTAPSLKSSRASELVAFLESNGVTPEQVSDPIAKIKESWDLVFFLSLDGRPARPLQQWIDLVKAKKLQGRFVVLYDVPLNDDWRAILEPEIEIGDEHSLEDSLVYLFEETVPESFEASSFEASSFEASVAPPMVAEESTIFHVDPTTPEESVLEFTSTSVEPSLDSLSLSLGSEDANEYLPDEPESVQEESVSLDFVMDESASNFDVDSLDEPVAFESVDHPDADISSPLAGRDTFNSEIDVDDVMGESAIAGTHVAPLSEDLFSSNGDDAESPSLSVSSGSDSSTLQKYAALKEREAREKESTILVLQGQVAKLDAKLSRSEAERRRLSLAADEMKLQLSTFEESLSQKQFHIQKMESVHHEEVRGITLRLDNAIFQANKAQNKLEEFRERVRTDFVKIRAQERELFNKLELQKRDAEALLASKDEQLLNQKREIDRFQYETETLRERLLEETEKAEERSSRLARAVQSLKLANDMLSGLSEEVLPAASDSFGDTKDKGEDAA